MSLPWFPLWADRLAASRKWRGLRRDASAKATYFALLLCADRDPASPFCGWVGLREGTRMTPFPTVHALADALDLDHRTVGRALVRLEQVALIRLDGRMIEVLKFRDLLHRRRKDSGVVADHPGSHLGSQMENAPSSGVTTYDVHTATATSSPSENDSAGAPSPRSAARKRKPHAPDDTAPTSELIDHWKSELTASTGVAPEIRFGHHARVFADVWNRTGKNLTRAKRVISLFFLTDHALKAKNGASIRTFQAIVERLIQDEANEHTRGDATPQLIDATPERHDQPASREEAARYLARFQAQARPHTEEP